MRNAAESRAAHRSETKAAALGYLERCQRLQGLLDARKRGEQPSDLKRLIEDVWLAEKGVEIVSSDELRVHLIAHARALHEVVRDGA